MESYAEDVDYLIDPSMVLHKGAKSKLPDLLDRLGDGYHPFLPRSFLDFARDDIDQHYDDLRGSEEIEGSWNIYRFYGVYDVERAVNPQSLREFIAEVEPSRAHDDHVPQRAERSEYRRIYGNLPYDEGDVRKKILYEELWFLFEYSPILSRIKRPFRHLMEAGIGVIEYDKQILDDLDTLAGSQQATLDQFGISTQQHHQPGEVPDQLSLFNRIYYLLKSAKKIYKKTRHQIYVAFGDVLDVLQEYFGENAVAQQIVDLQTRVNNLLHRLSEENPKLADELDKIADELEILVSPPGVRRGLAVMRILLSITTFTFVLIDP